MQRDPQLLLSIQIALMGIVLVVGFFFVWRAISRIEARLDELSSKECNDINAACAMMRDNAQQEKQTKGSFHSSGTGSCPVFARGGMDKEPDSDEDDDVVMMRSCFGDVPIQSLIDEATSSFMMFKESGIADADSGVVLEEIQEDSASPPIRTDAAASNEDDGSLGGTEAGDLSRSKLRKMNLDGLKELCASRGLSTEGTKAALIDRVLSSLPSN